MCKSLIQGQSTTLKQELEQNRYLKNISKESFERLLSEDKLVYPSYFYHVMCQI